MAPPIPDILGKIVARKQAELVAARKRRSFEAALRAARPAIIAEIKKASPSRGVLVEDFDPSRIARQYAAGGAAALSVLTDRDFFQGCLGDLEAARAVVDIPVLRKDFTTDEYHVVEAATHGADAILLIAAILDVGQMRGFRELAEGYGMSALVEVHDEAELDCAVASGAKIVGVNNRDLRSFDVRLETSLRLAERIPSGIFKVSESGIRHADDVRLLMGAGFDAFLVGEHLMKSGDPAGALRSLTCL